MELTPKRLVLVIGDESVDHDLLWDQLTNQGYQVKHIPLARAIPEAELYPRPDLVIFDLSQPETETLAPCRQLRQSPATAQLPIIVLSGKSETAAKVAAFEAGADDYMAKPFERQELVYRIQSLLRRYDQAGPRPPDGPARGRIIALFGTKGGVGKTTLAVNLAVALQTRAHKKVALLDEDLYFGDVGLYLNLAPTRTMMDLIHRLDEVDSEMAEQLFLSHSSGVRVMLSPTNPETAERITAAEMNRMLDLVAPLFDYVIVDCQPSYDDPTLAVLEQADVILLVVKPEVGPLKNMGVFLNLADRLHLPSEKIHIVLNRARTRSGIEVDEIERSFRRPVAFSLTSGGRAVVVSANRGVPLVTEQPNHPVSQQILRMAEALLKMAPTLGSRPMRVPPPILTAR